MTIDQITEPDRLTSLADMADAAWLSVLDDPRMQLQRATLALKSADSIPQQLSVYIQAIKAAIERAEAKASTPTVIRAADLAVEHIHRVMSGLGTTGGDLGMVHGVIVWITFTEDNVRVGVCDRPDSGAHDVEFSHSDPITIEAGK